MADLQGILQGLNQGLSQGLDSYNQARNRQIQQQYAQGYQQNIQGGLLAKGITQGDQGQPVFTPEKQAQVDYEREKLDPNSETSQKQRNLTQGILKTVNPEYAGLITPNMSAHDIENNPYINDAVRGEYGAKGREIVANRMQQGIDIRKDQQSAQAASAIHNDKLVTDMSQRKNQIGIDRHTLESGGQITPQMLAELSQGIASALSGARGASVHSTEMQEIKNLDTESAKLKSYLLSRPEEATNPQIRQQMVDILNRLEDSYDKVRYRRAQQVGTGKKYRNNPDAQQNQQEAIESYNPAKGTGLLQAQPQGMLKGGPKVGDIEDGHKFLGGDPADPKSWQKVQ